MEVIWSPYNYMEWFGGDEGGENKSTPRRDDRKENDRRSSFKTIKKNLHINSAQRVLCTNQDLSVIFMQMFVQLIGKNIQ